MKLILDFNETDVTTKMEVEGKATVDSLIAVLFSALEGTIRMAYEDADEDARLDIYEALDALFCKFMERVFPDIQPRAFDFSDAAMLYAQDLIIEKAHKEGKTFEEVMKDFEDEAKAYVNARIGGIS